MVKCLSYKKSPLTSETTLIYKVSDWKYFYSLAMEAVFYGDGTTFGGSGLDPGLQGKFGWALLSGKLVRLWLLWNKVKGTGGKNVKDIGI